MGAILHVNVFYTDLKKLFETIAENKVKVFGALIEGESIYSHKLENNGIILLGNESKGISEELLPLYYRQNNDPKISSAEDRN